MEETATNKIKELEFLIEDARKIKEQIWKDIKSERVPFKEGVLSLMPYTFGIRELNEKIRELRKE